MRKLFLLALLALAALPLAAQDNITLVIHGGAGTLTPSRIPPDEEREYAAALELALRMGHAVLAGSGSSVAAVEAAIRVLEDSPLFNAGKGAVLTRDGLVQLDASIMDGRTRRAGAVATVSTIRNPITGARLVMENSPHVMMSGPGAEAFAASQGAEIVDPSYFLVDKDPSDVRPRPVRRGFLSVPEWWNAVAGRGSRNGVASRESRVPGQSLTKYGTVGAVALDRGGNLAAGTSTGGLQNKLSGRIGDSPIIGAGTYADNQTAAISGTGIGEFFMRNVVAYDIAALMRYRGLTVSQAAADAIARLTQQGAPAGVIALDAAGNFTMPFNTDGMFRGFVRGDGVPHVFIFRD